MEFKASVATVLVDEQSLLEVCTQKYVYKSIKILVKREVKG